MQQACAREGGLAGVRRPYGGKGLGSAAALTGDAKSSRTATLHHFHRLISSKILVLRANFCEPKSCRGKYRATSLMFELWSKTLQILKFKFLNIASFIVFRHLAKIWFRLGFKCIQKHM